MPLLPVWKKSPEAILAMTIEQIVAIAGDGKLKDSSECSIELRSLFGEVTTEKLSEYAEHCLINSFDKSGLVLQDIINEIGRRLDFQVINGDYQGTSHSIGNDGLWISDEENNHKREIVVEVKTTDAYRLSLDTIASYRSKLINASKISQNSSVLIIVGRKDTGELEAQIRGSRHAWDMRLISIDALIRLALLKESTGDPGTVTKIQSILTPIEYTRLDTLIDVMLTTARDIENKPEIFLPDDTLVPDIQISNETKQNNQFEFTDSHLIQKKREQIISALSSEKKTKFIKKSKALYWNSEHNIRLACTISKRYQNQLTPYWYAYHPSWNNFLTSDNSDSYFVLGCMDLDIAFSIPLNTITQILPFLNSTEKSKGEAKYWHIKILQSDSKYFIQIPKSEPIDLSPYTIPVT